MDDYNDGAPQRHEECELFSYTTLRNIHFTATEWLTEWGVGRGGGWFQLSGYFKFYTTSTYHPVIVPGLFGEFTVTRGVHEN